MKKIVISIIVYKADLEILMKSLEILSVNKQENDLKFIVIDNNNGAQIERLKSQIETRFSKEFSSRFSYISSPNLGYGKGHNFVFDSTKSEEFDYFLCVNPDGIFHPDCINNLVSFAKDKEGVFEAIQHPVEHPKVYDKKTWETNWCSGACIMFSKELFSKLDGFDKDLFMYCEDVDISWRARKIGYRCYTVANAKFSHYVDTSERDLTFMKTQMLTSGLILAIKYNAPVFAKICKFRLKKYLLKQDIDNISKNIIKYTENYKNIVTFRHLFYFSSVRW